MRRLVFSGIGLTLFGAISYFNVGNSGGIMPVNAATRRYCFGHVFFGKHVSAFVERLLEGHLRVPTIE